MAINIAILGFGTVGSGVAETLDINKDVIAKRVGEEIVVKHILDIRDSLRADLQLLLHIMRTMSSLIRTSRSQ